MTNPATNEPAARTTQRGVPPGIQWAAVAYGTVAGLVLAGISIAVGLFAPYQQHPEITPWVILVNRMLGIISYAVAGIVAGRMATERAVLHGALAGLGAGIAGRAIALVLTGAMYGRVAIDAQGKAWMSSVGWLVVGVAIGAVSGALAAAVRVRKPAP